jgi:nucleotide-binding universal stress UspA family protein
MDAQEIDGVEPVVAGIDDTPHALHAARWAGAEAARLGVPLRLVAVTGLVGEHLPGRVARCRALERVLDRARAAAAEAGADRVGTAVRSGIPVDVLAQESRAASLLVVGDRGAGRVEGLLAGSVAVGLLGRASCPVVVVRGADRDAGRQAGRPVVVGLDLSPASTAVLDAALDAAASRGVGLVVVHAVPDPPADPTADPTADLLVAPAAARSARAGTEHRVPAEQPAARAARRGVPVRSVTAAGRAAEVLLAEARDAQLVVVGSRGRGELAGLVRGSVSTVLVHRADCPVLVVGPLAAGSDVPRAGHRRRRPVGPGRTACRTRWAR